jgi:hypothetical protein
MKFLHLKSQREREKGFGFPKGPFVIFFLPMISGGYKNFLIGKTIFFF